jgi:hypothetical protein
MSGRRAFLLGLPVLATGAGCIARDKDDWDEKNLSIQYNWIALRKDMARRTPNHGFSTCNSCKLPWWVVDGHTVMYFENMGMFAICEMCWKALGPEGSLPFYIDLVREQYPGDTEKEKAIHDAIVYRPYIQPEIPGLLPVEPEVAPTVGEKT